MSAPRFLFSKGVLDARLRGAFAFAGLWETWTRGDGPVESCTPITTEANGTVAPVHARMPVILLPEEYERWLDSGIHEPSNLDFRHSSGSSHKGVRGHPGARAGTMGLSRPSIPRPSDPRC